MWARLREIGSAFVFILMILAVQSQATGNTSTDIPVASLDGGDAGAVVLNVQETYVTVDLKTTDPDVVHIPTFTLQDGGKAAKGVLQRNSDEEEVTMPLVHEEGLEDPGYVLVLDQDWPQNWDELVIELDEQDWPQYNEIVIPLAFQDWPQSWLPAELV